MKSIASNSDVPYPERTLKPNMEDYNYDSENERADRTETVC